METDVFQAFREIEALGQDLHGSPSAADTFTFRSMKEHVEEVRGLLKEGDAHWKAEAVDLIIHGHLLLVRHGVPPQEIGDLLERRTGRFREKISAAIRGKRKKKT